MPKSNRDKILKKYDQADNDLDRCLTNLRDLEAIYEPAHPMQHTAIVRLAGAVLLVQDMLRNVRSELA